MKVKVNATKKVKVNDNMSGKLPVAGNWQLLMRKSESDN
jgi:hypothetical protein